MSYGQPFQFEPERHLSAGENIEDITQNEDDQRVEEEREGQNGVCATTSCLCQPRGRVSIVKSSAFCKQLFKVS